jgi:regulator of sigma E protease
LGNGLSALFWGIITFSILIVIHEGGHFAAARLFGVKVHEFMIGLPGPALRIKGPKTTYGITAIPLGGYVRIAGMEPGPEDPRLATVLAAASSEESVNAAAISRLTGIAEPDADMLLVTLADWDALVSDPKDKYTYTSRFSAIEAAEKTPGELLDRARVGTYRALPTGKRIVLLLMGVVTNLLTAILLITIILSVFGFYRQTMRVGEMSPGSAASKAGMQVGDKVLAVDGVRVRYWMQLVGVVSGHKAGDKVTVTVQRGASQLDLKATLGRDPKKGRALLGITEKYENVPRGRPLEAFGESFSYIGLVFVVIAGLFNPQTFVPTISQSSSIIGASYMAASAARESAVSYVGLIAMLSVSLGVINVFPIPPLDGGKIVIEVLERLRGKPLSRNFSLALSGAGAVVLFALIAYLMYSDVMKFIVS